MTRQNFRHRARRAGADSQTLALGQVSRYTGLSVHHVGGALGEREKRDVARGREARRTTRSGSFVLKL